MNINDSKEIELMEVLKDWVKTEQEPRFWETAKELNLLLLLVKLSPSLKRLLVLDIVCLLKMAQRAAFHDGLYTKIHAPRKKR